MKNFITVSLISLLAIVAGCSSGGGGNDNSNEVNAGTTGTVQGVIYAPNGTDPVSGAVLYVPSNSSATIQFGVIAMVASTCQDPGTTVVTSACSGADGSFTLTNVPAGNTTVVIAKGLFKKTITVNVTGGGTANLTAVETTLPSTSGPGTQTPRIAVVTGLWDEMEHVLAKMGFGTVDESGALISGTEKFTLIDGNFSLNDSAYQNFDFTLGSIDELKKYDLIVINCGNSYEDMLVDASVIARIKQYVNEGGRIYVTDQSYDFVEQAFPEYVDFLGSDAVAGTDPEVRNAAEVGDDGITTDATILQSPLVSWLGNVRCGSSTVPTNTGSCLNQDGTVHIEDFLVGWAVINGAHPSKTSAITFWIQGNVSWSFLASSGVKPLTLSFPYGSGKVLYSSYHTAGTAHPYLVPQERILQYLIFEIVQ